MLLALVSLLPLSHSHPPTRRALLVQRRSEGGKIKRRRRKKKKQSVSRIRRMAGMLSWQLQLEESMVGEVEGEGGGLGISFVVVAKGSKRR